MTICLIVVYAILAWALLNVLVASAAAMWYRAWCRSVLWTPGGIMPSAVSIDEGSGEDAVLFVHGFNDVPYVWRRFVDELVARGFHCQALRLPGAGEADCRPSLGVLRKAVDDELRTLKAAHRRVFIYRLDRFYEIGWYSALFALVTSLRRADRRKIAVSTVVYVAGDDRVVDLNASCLWFADVPCARIVDCPGASHVIPLNYVWNGVISEISDKQKERNIYLK